MAKSRTNIEIEDEYVAVVMDRYGVRTKTEAVDLALRIAAGQPMTREEALAMLRACHRKDPGRQRARAVILVDTSAWVEFDRATGSAVDRRLTELIDADAPIATTEPVLMEVLAGAKSDARARDLRRLLLRSEFAPVDSAVDFEAAARIYRTCRRSGVTPRGLLDCLIASVAKRSGMSLLEQDVDLRRVADVIGIPLELSE